MYANVVTPKSLDATLNRIQMIPRIVLFTSLTFYINSKSAVDPVFSFDLTLNYSHHAQHR